MDKVREIRNLVAPLAAVLVSAGLAAVFAGREIIGFSLVAGGVLVVLSLIGVVIRVSRFPPDLPLPRPKSPVLAPMEFEGSFLKVHGARPHLSVEGGARFHVPSPQHMNDLTKMGIPLAGASGQRLARRL